MALGSRNNCQSGKWVIGDKEYGSKAEMLILKFSKFFGSLGQTDNTLWGQVWFVAESGDLPRNTVMVTYIKGRSLRAFNRLVASVQSRGIEPAEGIFIPEFIKHSGQKPDENGLLKPINYYSLEWEWKERQSDEEWNLVEQAAAALENHHNLMIDMEATSGMVCLDNLPAQEIAQLMAHVSNVPELPGSKETPAIEQAEDF